VVTRRLILLLVAIAVVLLVTFAVSSAMVFLLDELVDAGGALLARRLAVACLAALVVDLICLLLAVGVYSADPRDGDFQNGNPQDNDPHDGDPPRSP
jgi:hypothetical protein